MAKANIFNQRSIGTAPTSVVPGIGGIPDMGRPPGMHEKGQEKLEISHGLGRERKHQKHGNIMLDLD